MTYLGYYFDHTTREIVFAQDTLGLSAIDYSYGLLMDKVYHHEQSNVLIGGAGSFSIWGVGGILEEQTYNSYDELLQGAVEAAVYMRTLGQEILAETSTKFLSGGNTQLFVFGFDEDNEPKLTIIQFSEVGFSNVPILLNNDEAIRNLRDNAYHQPMTTHLDPDIIPDEMWSSHEKTFDLYDTAITKLSLDLKDMTSMLIVTALSAHFTSCFTPIQQGGLGSSIGGELVEYRINANKEYKEKVLFVFPDNNLHGIPDNEPRLRLSEVVRLQEGDEMPLALKRIIEPLETN
jgi:hypothetical protein